MFANLTDKFSDAFRQLSGRGRISEANIREAMDQVRTALLEADVHYEVVESFVAGVTQKALGAEVLASLKPGQLMIKIVHDQLLALISGGEQEAGLMYVQPGPTIIMMCGLQGSGKTTTCADGWAPVRWSTRAAALRRSAPAQTTNCSGRSR